MSIAVIVATDKPNYRTSGLITASSGTYDVAVPTATIPSTTGQTFLLPTNLGDKPSSLRLVPVHSADNATTPSMRVVGWTTYLQTNNTPLYVPTLLADLACAYNGTSGSIPSLSVNGTTQYFFHGLTLSGGAPTGSATVYNPGTSAALGTPPACASISLVGMQYVTFQFESSTGTMGAFYALL
jgi:hypothetical protein